MEYPVFSRNFQVDYFEKSEGLWQVTSHLKDHVHDILVRLEISTPEMVIQDAEVKFIRYPLEGCLKFVDHMKKIIGANLFENFHVKLAETFLGREGCPNVMNLVGIAAPALMFFYFPNQMNRGKMRPDEMWNLMSTKLGGNCIGH